MKTGSLAREAWGWLGRELDHWTAQGRRAHFWWRDDDAGETCERLDRLLALSTRRRIPLALASIPIRVDTVLADRLSNAHGVRVLQHGYAHRNHAAPGRLRLELGGDRAGDAILADLQRGLATMRARFGSSFSAVLVPPWNRIDDALIRELAGIGFRGLSTHKARRSARPAAGLLQVNTHLDPVHWRRDNGFIGVYPAVAILVQHLLARRSGYRDSDEPTGILSHHLAMNEATWGFLDELLDFLAQHPAVEFVGADEIWG